MVNVNLFTAKDDIISYQQKHNTTKGEKMSHKLNYNQLQKLTIAQLEQFNLTPIALKEAQKKRKIQNRLRNKSERTNS